MPLLRYYISLCNYGYLRLPHISTGPWLSGLYVGKWCTMRFAGSLLKHLINIIIMGIHNRGVHRTGLNTKKSGPICFVPGFSVYVAFT